LAGPGKPRQLPVAILDLVMKVAKNPIFPKPEEVVDVLESDGKLRRDVLV
jgi:hypothetical protein